MSEGVFGEARSDIRLIEEFVSSYEREVDFYATVAGLARDELETSLIENGIRAIVTARAKRPDSLRTKLEGRKHRFQSLQEIRDDIVDLAGARVALYFPAQRDAVGDLIATAFNVVKVVEFPQPKVPSADVSLFPGYIATHHRVRLSENRVTADQKRHCGAMIEIQVASVLMHAWAEVEHDLAYKPLSGDLSADERLVLDSLNALVLSGETSLELLQRAMERRIHETTRVFRDQYDLAAFLSETLARKGHDPKKQTLGRTDILLDLLRALKLDTPGGIESIVVDAFADGGQHFASERIIDKLIASPDNRKIYEEIRKDKDEWSEKSATLRANFRNQIMLVEDQLRQHPDDLGLQAVFKEFSRLRNLGLHGRVKIDDQLFEAAVLRMERALANSRSKRRTK